MTIIVNKKTKNKVITAAQDCDSNSEFKIMNYTAIIFSMFMLYLMCMLEFNITGLELCANNL